jgi:hypothetical protein
MATETKKAVIKMITSLHDRNRKGTIPNIKHASGNSCPTQLLAYFIIPVSSVGRFLLSA